MEFKWSNHSKIWSNYSIFLSSMNFAPINNNINQLLFNKWTSSFTIFLWSFPLVSSIRQLVYSDTSWLAFCHISDIFWESCNNVFTYMNLVFVTDKFIFVFIVYCEHLLRIFINSLRCCKLLMDVDFLYSTTHTLLSLFIISVFTYLLRSSHLIHSEYYYFQEQV